MLVLDVPVMAPGALLAPGYTVLRHVSRGEALDVYEVFSSARLCSCIAKTVRPDRAHQERVRDRLRTEGRLLQSLAHPHLVRAFETLDDDVPVVVTETLPGLTLEEVVDERRRRLPAADLAHLGMQLCSAVQYLHRAGVLHLDIRPGNVLAFAGRAVLIDLSLARPPGPAPRGTGTREYLSPEQARGGDLTPAADVWGLGLTLYEAATAVQPFLPEDDGDDGSHGYLQLQQPAPAVRTLRRGLPTGLTTVVEACLDASPPSRPTARELWQALAELVEEAGDEDGDGAP